ncbi:MAG TPA: hypothetical protein VGG18_14185 [Granulicella sp.]|jgi:hypothetical protein
MSTAIFREPTPEEVELAHQRRILASIRAVLAERELELNHLRNQIISFETRYIRQVGVLYRQLDEWEERIAELKVSQETPEERERYVREAAQKPEAAPSEEPAPERSLDLRNLFREVAKLIHPDFAIDDHDELHRTRLMAQANEAYRRDDAAVLQRMLNGYDPSTDQWNADDVASALTRTLTQIQRANEDVKILASEIEALSQSEMAQLKERTVEAALNGRDLLAELAAMVKGNIGMAMRRYELDLGRARRKEKAFNPNPLLSAEAPASSRR